MKTNKYNDTNINYWVCSDLHLNHDKEFIYKKRGYNNVTEHNLDIIQNINKLVQPDDILFSLGDFCLNTDENQLDTILNQITCQNIYIIWGNHPNPLKKIYNREVYSKYNDENIEIYPFRYKNVVFLGYHYECTILGRYVVMNHFPIEVWDHMKHGAYMLCGHSHYSLKRTRKECTDGLTLDCGWEGHKTVLNFKDIIKIMNYKTIRVVDHHA
jgi:calcineurin-like phosphoesterase family protein